MTFRWYEIWWGTVANSWWLTCHVEDAVAGADVGQEGVSQALALVGAFHQASDVNDIEECWHFAATQAVRAGKGHLRR